MPINKVREMSEVQKKKHAQLPNAEKICFKTACTTRSKRAAIKAMCRECFGWENPVKQIRECTSKDCPLYNHRPYK